VLLYTSGFGRTTIQVSLDEDGNKFVSSPYMSHGFPSLLVLPVRSTTLSKLRALVHYPCKLFGFLLCCVATSK
jgi:hypothetical protein